MPGWRNTDTATNKPKSQLTRQVRTIAVQAANTVTPTGNANLFLLSSSGANTSQYVTGNNINTTINVPGFYKGNVTVSSVDSGNNKVVISTGLTANNVSGDRYVFDNNIPYRTNSAFKTGFDDVVLVTPGRMSNSTVNVAKPHTGWNHIRKKTNNDGSVRYIAECLVAMSNTVAANTSSGNTSFGQIFTGV